MGKIIKLASVNKKEQKYLKQFNVDSLEKLSLEQGNKFFVKIIQDFKDYKLSPDELSVFGSMVFHAIGKKNEGSELFSVSLSVSDINYMVRNKNTYRNIPDCLEDIDKFLEKHNI